MLLKKSQLDTPQSYSRLSYRLLTTVFSLYICIALTVTLTQIYTEYHQKKYELKEEISHLYGLFEPLLTTALWDVNDENVRSIASSLTNYPAIVGIEILGDFNLSDGHITAKKILTL